MDSADSNSLQVRLDELCRACPRGHYTRKCPFPALGGLSFDSRRGLFAEMSRVQIENLFDLATDCLACPADPRRGAPGK